MLCFSKQQKTYVLARKNTDRSSGWESAADLYAAGRATFYLECTSTQALFMTLREQGSGE